MTKVCKCDELSPDTMIKPDETPSEIQKFYSGSSIFITGASGYIGQLLTEKLLRSCPDVAHVYLLMREKKGKRIEERFDTIFKDVLFDRLRLEQPKFCEKIILIPGDCELSNLGLTESSLELIRSKVDIVFHVAATVRFDEKLRKAVAINVSCVKDLLCIAKTMPNLKAFVHVSTAYSNCIHPQVKEVFYGVPITCDKLIDICDTLDDSQLDTLTPQLLGQWPNTYSFTKAIAENALKIYGQKLPLTIVRPSIVISTANEPVPGWINNYYGAVGITVGVSVGLIHVLHCDPNNLADLIPADYTVNSLIAAGWQVGTSYNLNDQHEITDAKGFEDIVCDDNIPIYNNVSSAENPLTWSSYMTFASDNGKEYGSTSCIWYYFLLLTPNRYIYLLGILLTHLLPGVLVDGICRCIGKKPRMLDGYKKIHNFANVLTYFMCKQWHFHNSNTQALWRTLNETDRRLFDFNVAALDWRAFFQTYMPGIRINLLKDPLETLPQGRAKHFKLKIAHYTLVTLLTLALIKLTVVFLKCLFNAINS